MAETYTLKLLVDDSAVKALEKRLQNIMGISSGSTSGGTGGNQVGALQNIAKLGAIAAGIAGLIKLVQKIADMTVSASPMLQAMLKLFDTSIMLILRPIGDFIGFTLRPIMIFLLQYVALPFYRYFAPFMQNYGNKLGNALLSFLTGKPPVTSPGGTTGKLGTDPNTAIQNLVDNMGGLQRILTTINTALDPKTITDAWNKFTSVFTTTLILPKPLTDAINSFREFIVGINIPKYMMDSWDSFTSFFKGVGGGMKPLFTAWDKLYAFFSPIGKIISDTLSKGWQKLVDFFQMIIDFFKDPLGTLSKAFGGGNNNKINPMPRLTDPNAVNSIAQAGANIENLVIHLTTELGTDSQEFLKDPVGFINRIVQNSIRRTISK